MIRWSLGLALGLGFMLAGGGVRQARAQGGLANSDRLLIYYYSYYAQQNSQRILDQQRKMQKQLDREWNQTAARLNRPPQYDPIDAYVRERGESDRQRAPLPRIYSGGHNYFQRAPYFGPNQGPRR